MYVHQHCTWQVWVLDGDSRIKVGAVWGQDPSVIYSISVDYGGLCYNVLAMAISQIFSILYALSEMFCPWSVITYGWTMLMSWSKSAGREN